jgi:diguanylate cyclase (GGDEF)-like protein
MLLDLDRFKRVNDRHGHAGGDAVLQRSAAVMRESLRQQDGVGRWGGEEFVVWLPGTARDDALGVAEKLRQALRACAHPMPGLDVPLTVTASIGVAEIAPGEPLLQALSRADGAMYEAKRGGRDRVVCAA